MAKVYVYKNLTKNCYSLCDVKTRKVIGHVKNVILKDVVFKVSEKGRQWVITNKKKIVHAGVQGNIVNAEMDTIDWIKIRYNPYVTKGFTKDNGELLQKASYVSLTDKGIIAYV